MKIAVLLSGGVDSSVALHLLRQQDEHELVAFYLKIWLEEEIAFLGNCPWQEDLSYVQDTCRQLGVPLQIIPMQTEYLELVVDHALGELSAGRTPSPDIFCNQRIKFGEFYRRIDKDFAKVASGHYARNERIGNTFHLRQSPDKIKDQTYFLSHLNQAQLARVIFPIGHLTKPQVRQIAVNTGLPARLRRDSQGICFLGKIDYRDFVSFHLGEQTGDIIENATDKRLGRHRGFWFYTIGQRYGLGLGGGPWYVVRKDPAANRVYVSHRANMAEQRQSTFITGPPNWICGAPSVNALRVKLRHGPEQIGCRTVLLDGDRLQVSLNEPDAGVAAGQHAVFYNNDMCLGGAIIE